MARKRSPNRSPKETPAPKASAPVEEMLLAALERGDDSLETGRYLATFRDGAAAAEASGALAAQGLRVADARDFGEQAAALEAAGDADAVFFPEIGVALISTDAARERGTRTGPVHGADSPIASIEPEHFVFAHGAADDYLRGFARAAQAIAEDLGSAERAPAGTGDDVLASSGATWGLVRCNVPPSTRSGIGIKVAVLDTGMDLKHPDFTGRPVVSQQFVGQPVQDLHSHGTHCIGTSCGPQAPAGSTPRYGIAHKAQIYAGKVLANSGVSVGGSVLNGMNWAIANRCTVISMSLGSQAGVQPYYTAAGAAALANGLLIVAAAGNAASNTGAPANSPTIMSVASLDPTLTPSSFSNFGKIEIAAPGRDVFSSVPIPRRYGIKSGTSMATPHVAGCAALWAESSASLRGASLWKKLQATAKRLPFPATRVGAGLVQAP